MEKADPLEKERRWVEQWRVTGPLLDEIKTRELRAMTDDEARSAAEIVVSAVTYPLPPDLQTQTSGLVEQQKLFRRAQRC